MTASRAYIAGIGTTGVLIGFALLMLAVVSAIVAFRGWPADTVVEGAGAVTVGEGSGLVEIEPVHLGEPARDGAGGAAAARGNGADSGPRTAGGRFEVRGVSQSESARPGPGASPAPGPAGSPSAPAAPGGGGDVTGGDVTGGVTDGAVGAVGDAVGPVTEGLPQVGGSVGETLGGVGGRVQQKAGELGLR
ncbi:MAG TPA: hypothetical protein VHG69_01360 [Thermoleophilaceae bacterium]|nr:hypothetical protein [Thermoleophilaceae bacterium]